MGVAYSVLSDCIISSTIFDKSFRSGYQRIKVIRVRNAAAMVSATRTIIGKFKEGRLGFVIMAISPAMKMPEKNVMNPKSCETLLGAFLMD